MGFQIYKRTVAGDFVCYSKVKPLKLGGPDGLIARHVKTLDEAECRSWKLDAATLLMLADQDPAENTVLFDVAGRDATHICLYELSKIHGSCRDTSTQLALDFSVLIDKEVGDEAAAYAANFEITPPLKPKLLGETLSLTGGPGGGDWKWGAPPLHLGATVVQAHGPGSGEPCSNCTCGIESSSPA